MHNQGAGNMVYLVTRKELKGWTGQLQDAELALAKLKEGLQALGLEKVSYSREGGSDTGDDETVRLFQLGLSQVQKIQRVISNAEIVELPASIERLSIGHILSLQRCDSEGSPLPGWRPERYLIGGYESNDQNPVLPVLSYDAPILVPFFRRRIKKGDFEKVFVNGEHVWIEILGVELPARE